MSTISTNSTTTNTPVGDTSAETAAFDPLASPAQPLAVRPDASPATHTPGQNRVINDEEVSGDVSGRDIEHPYINIAQKVGGLSDKFPFGSLIVSGETELIKLGGTLVVQALRMEKYYQQRLPQYDSNADLLTFSTAEEVVNNGGSLEYNDMADGMYFEPGARTLFLVRQPDEASDAVKSLCMFDVGGVPHLLAGFNGKGASGYTGVGPKLLTLKQSKGSIRSSLWNMTVAKKTYGSNTYGQLRLAPGGFPTPAHAEFIEKFRSILSK